MENVYIVVGICRNIESNNIFSLIGECGVQSNLENAKAELEECYNEIVKEWKETDLAIVEERKTEIDFYIENESGESYTYNIMERKIIK